MSKKIQMVMVVWRDATYDDAAHQLDVADTTCKDALTLGFLVKDGEDEVVVCSEIFDDGDGRHFIAIPRPVIEEVKYLKER